MLTYKILGPLEVMRDGGALPLGPAKQRALLACLLLNADATVSKDRLIDALWGQAPPDRADQNLFQHVFRLRKILDENGRPVLIRKDPGYLIQLGEDDVLDARRFEDLLNASRAEPNDAPARSLELLEEALALWRGPALADFAFDDFAQTDAARLEELHVVAEEERMEALLALGRPNDAIPELRTLVQNHPLREHLYALLALALYRAGRQAEALNAIQSARTALSAEYGIDIGRELHQLEEAILRQDRELALPEEKPAPATVETIPERVVPARPARGERRRHAKRGRRTVVVAAAAVVVAVAAVSTAILGSSDQDAPAGRTDTTGGPTPPRLSWTEVPPTYFEGLGQQKMLGGVETSPGFLVFGYSSSPAAVGGRADFNTAVWRGAPHLRWSPVEDSSFRGPGSQRATDAVEFGDGDIVLVGWDESGGDFDAAAWVRPSASTDWVEAGIEAQGPSGQLDQQIRDVARLGQTLLAVGWTSTDEDSDAAMWASRRGRSWTFVEGAPSHEEGDQEIAGATASTAGIVVAGGWSEGDDGDRDAAVWVTRTPTYLHRVRGQTSLGGSGDQQINAVIQASNGFVAVGEETVDGDTNAAVWRSRDGRDWERVNDPTTFGGRGQQRMFCVTVSDLGFIAAGSDQTDPDHWDAAVWTSIDGVNWERSRSVGSQMTALTDIGDQEIKALLPFEGGIMAVGSERAPGEDWDARVWIGAPLPR